MLETSKRRFSIFIFLFNFVVVVVVVVVIVVVVVVAVVFVTKLIGHSFPAHFANDVIIPERMI